MTTADFLIIGGGIIGMMTAAELAAAGADVTLLERGHCGGEASWAGGGILSPLYPWRADAAVNRLAVWSQAHYAGLTERLRARTGIDAEYHAAGHLYLEVQDRDSALAWARSTETALTRLSGVALYQVAPRLADGFEHGLWLPELASIRNPRLCRALAAWLRTAPKVTVHEDTAVERLLHTNGRVIGAATDRGQFEAENTVVCAGAWSSALLGTLGLDLAIRPVKGQMLLFGPQVGGQAQLDPVVLYAGRYLIPRADGRVLAGSTLESAGFDTTPTAAARADLHASAAAMRPALADCPVERQWAGLRPAAPDEVPFIGAVPGIDALFVNTGHYRSGLTLAPAAARVLADQLTGRPPIVDPAPYQPAAASDMLYNILNRTRV